MDLLYKKTTGSASISGHLYETRLISLIYFRLLHNDNIDNFCLASNMDGIGAFDDICFRVQLTAHKRPIVALIQVKHKHKKDLEYDLTHQLSTSFVKVRNKFLHNKVNDKLFNGKFEDTDYLFILYTNSTFIKSQCLSNSSANLNNIIATGESNTQGYQANYNEKDLYYIHKKFLEAEITMLVEHFAEFFKNNTNNWMKIMDDHFISKYHVILAKKVVNVSEIKYKQWRELTFRQHLFNTNDKELITIRNKMYQIFKKNKEDFEAKQNAHSYESTVHQLLSSFLSDPSIHTLSPLIGTHVINNNGELKINTKKPYSQFQRLKQINSKISPSIIEEAEKTAAKDILSSLKLKVPIAFGNVDLNIPGSHQEVEKGLDTLADIYNNLCKQYKLERGNKIVQIDETVDDKYLYLNGGIGGAIGNLLVYDKATTLLKFTENSKLLHYNAQNLLRRLKSKINDLYSYRFNVKHIVTFPKLAFDDYRDEAEKFFKRAVIYDEQSNHDGVKSKLKYEIENHSSTNGHSNSSVTSDSIITHYHDEIQKWWMFSDSAEYLIKSKDNNIYKQAKDNIISEPQISAMNITFNMVNNKYLGYNFIKNDLIVDSRTIIKTDVLILTILKVIKYLRKAYVVLDLEYIIHIPDDDFNKLVKEIKETKKILIFVCNITKNRKIIQDRLHRFALETKKQNIIVITDTKDKNYKIVRSDFLPVTEVNDERQSLIDLEQDSRKYIMENTEVTYQGENVESLNSLVDDESVEFIKGDVLKEIIYEQNITIGKSLSNTKYEKFKHLYVDRRVHRVDKYSVKAFDDISDDVVLITAEPGMGKSTLLTHLSVTTNKRDKLWIFKINITDLENLLDDYIHNKIVLDKLSTLQLLCQVIVNNIKLTIRLKEVNGKVYLDGCTGDEWATFELNMFLYFYNERNVIYLFDGFDEIGSYYKDKTIELLRIIKYDLRKHKMWITSRPYEDILPDLETVLGEPYELEAVAPTDQKRYLYNYWRDKIILANVSSVQLSNITYFINIMRLTKTVPERKTIAYIFYDYLNSYFPHICKHPDDLTRVPVLLSQTLKVLFTNIEVDDIAFGKLDVLIGNPLLLYICAKYFTNLILGESTIVEKWHYNMYYSAHEIYKMYIKEKLQTIYNNDGDEATSRTRDRFEKIYSNCVDKHQKLAAHAYIFHRLRTDELQNMAPFKDSHEYLDIINGIKERIHDIDLISHISDENIPVFFHKTIGEYLTAAYICDIYKKEDYDFTLKNFMYTTALVNFDLHDWINIVKIMDQGVLDTLEEIEEERSNVGDTYYLFCP